MNNYKVFNFAKWEQTATFAQAVRIATLFVKEGPEDRAQILENVNGEWCSLAEVVEWQGAHNLVSHVAGDLPEGFAEGAELKFA